MYPHINIISSLLLSYLVNTVFPCEELSNFTEVVVNGSKYCLSVFTGHELNYDEALEYCHSLGTFLLHLDTINKLMAVQGIINQLSKYLSVKLIFKINLVLLTTSGL